MDELKQREIAMREHTAKVNAGRKPVFGDHMRNLWASEQNPSRDAIFVRVIRRTGKVLNSGMWYQMTDGKGKFWEVCPSGMIFISAACLLRAACAADCEGEG